MKFSLQPLVVSAINSKCRLGIIEEIARIPETTFETPLLLLHSKGGSIPNLSHEVLQMLTPVPQCLMIPVTSTIHCYEAVKGFHKGIAHFAGLTEFLSYCTVQDPGAPTPVGYNDKSSVSIWSHKGRSSLTVSRYMDVMEAFQPDMYQALCDGDTNLQSTKKRSQKAVATSNNLFSACLLRHKESKVLSRNALLGVVEGGYNLEARKQSAMELAERPVSGYVIDGLHNNGADVETIPFHAVKSIVEETLKFLPEERLRIIHGGWSPIAVLGLVYLGIDVFDSSLAYITTERGAAFIFKYKQIVEPYQNGFIINKAEEMTKEDKSTYTFEMTMKDENLCDDFRPIIEDCSCLTCRKHTRAYIHHLLNTNELLASVLLTIHNLHHYMEFFRFIRESVKVGKTVRLIADCEENFASTL